MKHVSLVLTGLFCLSACGRGGAVEQPVLDGLREKGMERCETTAGALMAAHGMDVERVCGCAVDKVMAGKSAAQLMEITRSSPEVREAAERCAIEASLAAKK